MEKRLKMVRNVLDMTQKEFAKRLGMSTYGYQKWEKGALNEKSIKLISYTFNINPDWLRYGTGEMFTDGQKEDIRSEYSETRSDLELTILIMQTIDEWCAYHEVSIEPDIKSELTKKIFTYFSGLHKSIDKRDIREAIPLTLKLVS